MSKKIQKIFTDVAKRYDRVNKTSSLGLIVNWRKRGAAESLISKNEYTILDIATGTGELALEIMRTAEKNGKKVKMTAMDLNENMLEVARGKFGNGNQIRIERGDAMNLRYPDNTFDVVTSAFALRNVDSLERFSSEARRVLKKSGKFIFMEMARPDTAAERALLRAYWIAVSGIGILSDRKAYDWLVESIDTFDKRAFVVTLKNAGFRNIRSRNLLSGAAFMVTGNK